MKQNLGIPENHLKTVGLELNKLLADEFVLQTKTRNYHWNMEGPNFREMHLLFEEQVGDLDDMIDSIAERIRAIGSYAEARLEDYLRLTSLIEQPFTSFQHDQLKYLLGSHETLINNLRRLIPVFGEKYKDFGSADFATQLLGKHEKMVWMISAHLNYE